MVMSFLEAIVLAGGEDNRLHPLTSQENPKCLLSVGNSTLLLYSLTMLKQNSIKKIILIVNGDVAASKVGKYVQKEPTLQDLTIRVVTAPAESRSADAVRMVADSLIGDSVVVMSGDAVSDIPLATVIFTHRIRGAAITTVLAKRPTSASEVTKSGKAPKGVDYVALDERNQRLLLFAYEPGALRRVAVPHAAMQEYPQLEITTDLSDACIYVLSKEAISIIRSSGASSIKVDALPAMVNEQWRQGHGAARGCSSYMLPGGAKSRNDPAALYLRSLCPDYRSTTLSADKDGGPIFCGVYLAPAGLLCRRVNTLQSLLDVNRELASPDSAGHPKGLMKDLIHPTAEISARAIVASGCIVGEQAVIEDKTSVKRSVIGAKCKIGLNVKILNSVIMEACTIGDAVHIQNSILGPGVTVGRAAQLKNCHVGPNAKVNETADHRDEQLL